MATTRKKPGQALARQLVKHAAVAKALDVLPETLRDWVARGLFPEPHTDMGTTWLYDKAVIDGYLETQAWPEGTRFRAGVGRGRA